MVGGQSSPRSGGTVNIICRKADELTREATKKTPENQRSFLRFYYLVCSGFGSI